MTEYAIKIQSATVFTFKDEYFSKGPKECMKQILKLYHSALLNRI